MSEEHDQTHQIPTNFGAVSSSSSDYEVISSSTSDDINEEEELVHVLNMGYHYARRRVLRARRPIRTSSQTGEVWLTEILNGHPVRCRDAFRMSSDLFSRLCEIMELKYGLTAGERTSVKEKVAIFVHMLAHATSYKTLTERFQRSPGHVSNVIQEVLIAMRQFSTDMIRPDDPSFSEIPDHIKYDSRYYPFFKGCIGAIDGTHIQAKISDAEKLNYIGRKGYATQNVLAVCDFDLKFIFVAAGWEGRVHDSKMLTTALADPNYNFPHAPIGRYYLADAGFAHQTGFLVPFKGERYHLPDFRRGGGPRGYKEVFNQRHSSLRSAIERTFGIWKNRWQVLQKMPQVSIEDQTQFVCDSMALHNFIRKYDGNDTFINEVLQHLDRYTGEANEYVDQSSDMASSSRNRGQSEMNSLRESIAHQLMASTSGQM